MQAQRRGRASRALCGLLLQQAIDAGCACFVPPVCRLRACWLSSWPLALRSMTRRPRPTPQVPGCLGRQWAGYWGLGWAAVRHRAFSQSEWLPQPHSLPHIFTLLAPCYCLCPALSPTHICTRAHAHTLIHIHTLSHSLAHTPAAVKHVAEVIAHLGELMPRALNNHIAQLQPYLGCTTPTMRSALVTAMGSVLCKVSGSGGRSWVPGAVAGMEVGAHGWPCTAGRGRG